MFKLTRNPDYDEWQYINKVRTSIKNKAKAIHKQITEFISLDSYNLYDFHDIQFMNTFHIDDDSKEDIWTELQSKFYKIYIQSTNIDIYIASKYHPFFMFNDASAFCIPFQVGRPILLKHDFMSKDIIDFTMLLSHELTHSILHTKDYFCIKNFINDAYSYEMIFRTCKF